MKNLSEPLFSNTYETEMNEVSKSTSWALMLGLEIETRFVIPNLYPSPYQKFSFHPAMSLREIK